MYGKVIILLLILHFSRAFVSRQDQIIAVSSLIKRTIPKHAHLFSLEIITSDYDFFEIEGTKNRTCIRGNNGVSLASGFHHFLKYYCNCQVSWEGIQLSFPDILPTVPRIRITTKHKYRYYLNVCTFGYSTPWWDWDRWEREIDWMVLHGINAPLMFVGQEAIWKELYSELNVPTDDWFTGPGFLPWHRMGNLDGWQGPLSMNWHQKQYNLAKKILERERSFGMKPILPGFNGFVPPQFNIYFPNSTTIELSDWMGFKGTRRLSPQDPLFVEIGSRFTSKVVYHFGTDHLYAVDPYNELTPESNNTNYLALVAKSLYNCLSSVDPAAIWVLQGWFIMDKVFWTPERIISFLNAVPNDRLIVLDLNSEYRPLWNMTNLYYNHSFIWSMLHNFGGRTGLWGKMDNVITWPFEAKKAADSRMLGLGLTPEGIGTNPIMYDLLTDQIWRDKPVDRRKWVIDYATRRYGRLTSDIIQTWDILSIIIYNCPNRECLELTPSIIPNFPSLEKSGHPYYNLTQFYTAWKGLLNAAYHVSFTATLSFDVVDIGAQALSNIAIDIQNKIIDAYYSKDTTLFFEQARLMREIIKDLDKLLGSDKNFLLGVWTSDAISWGITDQEKKLYNRNAKIQITSWGDFKTSALQNYAYKMWAGLVGDLYYARWDLYLQFLEQALLEKKEFDKSRYNQKVAQVLQEWVDDMKIYPNKPTGDPIAISRLLYSKWIRI